MRTRSDRDSTFEPVEAPEGSIVWNDTYVNENGVELKKGIFLGKYVIYQVAPGLFDSSEHINEPLDTVSGADFYRDIDWEF